MTRGAGSRAAEALRYFARRDAELAAASAVVPRYCESCARYTPDDINPPAGMGWCAQHDDGRYPRIPACGYYRTIEA